MSAVSSLLAAFEKHYSTSEVKLHYTGYQRKEFEKRYGWISAVYAVRVYDEVISTHPTSLRSLPDIAIMNKASAEMFDPGAYEKPKLLEPPLDYDGNEDDRKAWLELLSKVGVDVDRLKSRNG